MGSIIAFVVGVVIGTFWGMMLTALLVAGSDRDEYINRQREEDDNRHV